MFRGLMIFWQDMLGHAEPMNSNNSDGSGGCWGLHCYLLLLLFLLLLFICFDMTRQGKAILLMELVIGGEFQFYFLLF